MSDKAPDENRPEPSDPTPADPTAAQPPADPTAPPPAHPVPNDPPPPGFTQMPPGQDPWQAAADPQQQPPPPGYDPTAYGAPGYGTPGYGPGYAAPGYGPPGYDPAGYQLPYGYYAGPADPLVSADFGGWWQRSFALLGAVWRPMVQVQLVWAIPLVAVGILTAIYGPDRTVDFTSTNPPEFDDLFGPLLVVLPFALIAVVLTLVAQLATLDVLVQRATGQPVSVGRALLTGLRRFFPMLGWQILAGLVTIVGLLLCILPGVYVLIVFLILPVIVLVERGQGISRAFQLVHADFGPAAARLAVIVGMHIAFVIAEGIFSAVLNPTTAAGPGVTVATAVLSTAFSVATGVVMSPLLLTAYADMRARREPFSTAYLIPHPGTN
ncbi:hypothetical protein M1L60_20105 [Actinoplanes sp. TRM 88003]|uniref:Glycerophosphoryl diester phosphodiesterase membrane domain-containing protein n=1 Tax=Paractinoplanes aksuensis TaxID=2939490 RepID=A0ABT1DPW8_9ACTN|nr:hypothetical protein [Actinoplanes aksuensis]MCO8272902.1 hypothetical protein [Actinoplanes aksuensis]